MSDKTEPVNIDVLKIIEFMKSRPDSQFCIFPIQLTRLRTSDILEAIFVPHDPEIFQLKVYNPYYNSSLDTPTK